METYPGSQITVIFPPEAVEEDLESLMNVIEELESSGTYFGTVELSLLEQDSSGNKKEIRINIYPTNKETRLPILLEIARLFPHENFRREISVKAREEFLGEEALERDELNWMMREIEKINGGVRFSRQVTIRLVAKNG